jgi:hypothetical protein
MDSDEQADWRGQLIKIMSNQDRAVFQQIIGWGKMICLPSLLIGQTAAVRLLVCAFPGSESR